MNELELLDGRVPALEMVDGMKELRIFAQRSRNRAQAADVLRMRPPGVVAAAIAVGDERGPHGPWSRYSTGRRRRSVMRKVDPFLAAVDEIGASSSRISNPLSLTTYSSSCRTSGELAQGELLETPHRGRWIRVDPNRIPRLENLCPDVEYLGRWRAELECVTPGAKAVHERSLWDSCVARVGDFEGQGRERRQESGDLLIEQVRRAGDLGAPGVGKRANYDLFPALPPHRDVGGALLLWERRIDPVLARKESLRLVQRLRGREARGRLLNGSAAGWPSMNGKRI